MNSMTHPYAQPCVTMYDAHAHIITSRPSLGSL